MKRSVFYRCSVGLVHREFYCSVVRCVSSSTGMILNQETEGLRGMMRMLALYDVIFLVSSTLLFDFVLEE